MLQASLSQSGTDRIAAWDPELEKGRRLDRKADGVAGEANTLSGCIALAQYPAEPEGCKRQVPLILPVERARLNTPSALGRTAKPQDLVHQHPCFILTVTWLCMPLLS